MLQRWLSFWKVLPSPQRNSRALSEWPSSSWPPPWPRHFSPDCSVWPWLPALGRVLVVPNFFHLRMTEVMLFLGTFNAAEMFWYPSRDLCLDPILSRSSTDNSWFGFCSDTQSTVWPYIDRSVPFRVMSNQLNLPQVDSNLVEETSQGWLMETGCTWAQFRVS